MKQVVINGAVAITAYNLDDAMAYIDSWCSFHDGVHEDPYENEDGVTCVDIDYLHTGEKLSDARYRHITAKIYDMPSRSGLYIAQSKLPFKPVEQ
jgi:hypothetical protein